MKWRSIIFIIKLNENLFPYPSYDGVITLTVTGPESARSSEIRFKKIFSTPGTYTISCKIGGRECREPLTLEILQPEVIVDRCKWIDEDHKSGNIITEAGINLKVCAFVHGNGLDNENLTVTVYDDDSAGRTDVYSSTFMTDDSHKNGFYLPFTITQDVIDKIKKAGFSDYGDLYFNIIRNGSDLPVKIGDKKLGEYLKVTLKPKIV